MSTRVNTGINGSATIRSCIRASLLMKRKFDNCMVIIGRARLSSLSSFLQKFCTGRFWFKIIIISTSSRTGFSGCSMLTWLGGLAIFCCSGLQISGSSLMWITSDAGGGEISSLICYRDWSGICPGSSITTWVLLSFLFRLESSLLLKLLSPRDSI